MNPRAGHAARRAPGRRSAILVLLALAAATVPASCARAATAVASPKPLTRPATREEGLERSISGNDIVCLARVLRVARLAPGDTTGHLAYLANIEPVDWVKGALDFDDSLTVYLPNDAHRTADALRAIARSRGDAAMLFFADAGGYWRVDTTERSPCGDHLGVLRVRRGQWKSELARLRNAADRVTLEGLARRADLVVIADCVPGFAPGPGANAGARSPFAVATVSESLKGMVPSGPVRVAQCCEPIVGRQLLFLRRLEGDRYEPLPFALPTRGHHRAAGHDVTVAEIEQARESIREAEESE